MEHIYNVPYKKNNQWSLEMYRIKKQTERLDRINQALCFAIKFLAVSASIGFITRFFG